MSFEYSALNESDIEECSNLVWQAYSSVPGDIVSSLYPGGYTPGTQAFFHQNMLSSLSDPTTSYVLVRNANTKALMAVARWHFQTEDKSLRAVDEADEAARLERASRKPIDGINFVAIDDFRDAQAKGRRDILQGKAHVKLGSLTTHPDHRRQGAGAVALDWGLRKADELGLPAYLEATELGRPLYSKYGFKDIMVLPFDARNHGHPHLTEQWCMLRDATERK